MKRMPLHVLAVPVLLLGLARTTAEAEEAPSWPEAPPPVAERCGPAHEHWNEQPLAEDRSPIDLRFLNDGPAGHRGRVRAQGDELVFEDGTPVRFWGVNLIGSALFRTPDAAIRRHAERLAALGFNLVRLHHHDSMRFVRPSVIDRHREDTSGLNQHAMGRLDRWIAELKRQGIYVWLDLETGRVYKPGDGITGYEELGKARKAGDPKGFSYVNPTLQEAMREFQRAFLGHTNPHTGLAYKDDPAVLGVIVANENDITGHFGGLLNKKNRPLHQAFFQQAAAEYAEVSGLPTEKLLGGKSRVATSLLLNHLEYRFAHSMRGHLRKLGFQGLVAHTSLWGGNGLASLGPLGEGDVVDVHAYGFPNGIWIDPREQANFLSHIAMGQLLGHPLTVTEWNHATKLASRRYSSALYLAGIASLQGWDAPMLYGYGDRPLDKPGRVIPWSSYLDPSLMGLMPAAALLYRQGHAAPARELFVLEPTRKDIFRERRNARKITALRTLVEQHRVAVRLPEESALPWWESPERPPGATPVSDLSRDFLPADADAVRSDTGELERHWKVPYVRIDTARSQAVAGAIGGRPLELGGAHFAIETAEASVSLSSLDGLPLSRSHAILLTALGQSCPVAVEPARYRSEPITGEVRLRRDSGEALQLQALGGATPKGPQALERGAGAVTIPLRADSHWYLITPKASSP